MNDQQDSGSKTMKKPHRVAAMLLLLMTIIAAVGGRAWHGRRRRRHELGPHRCSGAQGDGHLQGHVAAHDGLPAKALPGHQFDLAPLQFDQIEPAVKNRSIDFLICNSAIYVNLEVKYGVSRTMTLRNLVGTRFRIRIRRRNLLPRRPQRSEYPAGCPGPAPCRRQ